MAARRGRRTLRWLKEPSLPLLPPIVAGRIRGRDRRGSSSPVVVDTAAGPHLVKLRGAAQGPGSLVAEVITGAIADRLGLPVPPRRVIHLLPDHPTDDRNDELADLLQASVGENLGFSYLEGARPLFPAEVNRLDPDFAAQVRWLDWLVQNPDRGPANPNILVQGRRFWLIDHGAALPFQHDWRAVTETSPHRPEPPLPHLLDGHALRLAAWDPLLTALLTREALTAAVDDVPASFLAPLLPEGIGADALRRRRAAYVAFLWKRLQGPRGFSVAAG